MDSSDASVSPAGEAGHTAVVGRAGERETNASSRLAAPEASGRWETKEPCPMETAESTGPRETTMQEERSAAVRRDGEPLTSMTKRRRQTETEADAERPQTNAGERPPSPVRGDEEEPPPLGEDPAGQEVPAAAITGREGGTHENSESIRRFEEVLREEARGMLTGYLKDGTEYLSASTVRRVVQVASMSVVGSAIAVSRLDKEVRRVMTTYPEEDPITLADHMVRMCEEEVLDWMRTRTVRPGPDADPDPTGSPTGQELVDDLEKVLAEEEAERYPPPGSKEDAWMMKVLEQATKVHCFAEEICDKTTKEDWQPCAYQLYRWQMDQEVCHLYALFGGPEEDKVRVKGQRLAKAWMGKAVDSIKKARKHVGLRFRGTSGLDGPRQCHHEGPPMESRPCEIQARTATRRADRAWRKRPRRIKELCDGLADGAGKSGGDSAPTKAPGSGTESSPESSDSESSTDCFESCGHRSPGPEEDLESSGAEAGEIRPLETGPEDSESSESESSGTESEDSDSSESESGDSDPFDMEARRGGPLTSSSGNSESSAAPSDSEETDSSSADSGFAKPSSSDTKVDFTPSAPSLEETEEFGRKVTGLSGRARWQVRKLLAVLTCMRKNLPPSARIEAVRILGWPLGPGIETCRAIADSPSPGPAWASEGGDQIRRFLEEWQQKYKESEERYRAKRDEAFRSDDEAARAEEQLAAEKAAELEKRTKTIEQRLPVITAQLGILWSEVTGSSRPVPSEVRLTSTGTEMTAKEHVATAETHLRYAEGHLQLTEEHMADAEVHLKLVKAHLAALTATGSLELEPLGAATLPPFEPTNNEAGTDREGATLGENGSPIARSGAGPAERGSGPDGKTPHLGAGEHWACPVSECQESAAHPLDECEEFKNLSVPQRKRAIKEWNRCECCLMDCRDRETGSRCYRRIGFRRHHLLELVPQAEANQAGSKRRQQQRPWRKAAKEGQNTSRGRSDQDNNGRS
jgi:hypothetical protein